MCGGTDAVILAAEVRDVEVAEQNLVLRVLLLEGDRVPHLLQLSLVALDAAGAGRVSKARVLGGILLFLRHVGVVAGADLGLALLDEDVLHVLLADG